MMRSLFSGVSGLKTHQTAMDVIGNNIANVNTTAFKAGRVTFKDLVSQTISEATSPNGNLGGRNSMQVGLGVALSAITTDITEGSAQNTEMPLDFRIVGEGYFVILNPDGASYSYTRNGNFAVDSEGYLVTQQGNYVLGVVNRNNNDIVNKTEDTTNLEKIQITGTINRNVGGTAVNSKFSDYAIDAYGVVSAMDANGTVWDLARLVLATFPNAAGLDKEGSNLYEQTSNSGPNSINFVGNANRGEIQSGQLEMSNVQLSTELTNMIIIQRGFQANSRIITTSDTMLEELVNLKR
jgi:flagellar hook protein FlgE